MFFARPLRPVTSTIALCALVALAACSSPAQLRSTEVEPESAATVATPTTGTNTSATVESTASAVGDDGGDSEAADRSAIRIRLDRLVDDAATEGFESLAEAVLTDQRGWTQAGFDFTFDDTDFDYTVVLAEGSEVDELCLPYDTYGEFSCQIGPVVAINADRWRSAVDGWPTTLEDYQTMLVNHEVGHLLGQHHPESRCAGDGLPAPVMAQQSSGVEPCIANPWPLPWEINCASLGLEPLAPGFERDIVLTCGPSGPLP